MKVIIESEDGVVGMAQDPQAVEFHDVVELFKGAVVACGFHPNTVKEYFEELDEK